MRESESKRVAVNSKAWQDGWQRWRDSGRTLAELANKLQLSEDQLGRVKRGSGTTKGVILRAAKVFGVPPESLIGTVTIEKRHPGWAFNTRKGLRQDVPPSIGPDKAPYQSFIDKDNRACISYLWTEICGDWISTTTIKGATKDVGDVLSVSYFHSGKRSAPNVAIHPSGQVPRRRREGQDWLCFQARITAYIPSKDKSADPVTPVLGLRVGDPNHYQWSYRPKDQRHYVRLSEEFETFYFHLSNAHVWSLMAPYGAPARHGVPEQPNFRWLTTVVLEFGLGTEYNIDSRGEATVEIKNLCLWSHAGSVPKLAKGEKRSDFELASSTFS